MAETTQQFYIKGNVFKNGNVLDLPTFGSIVMPFPSEASIIPLWQSCENVTIGGINKRGVRERKYQYTMKWKHISVIDYDNLESEINGLEPKLFTYQKWPQSTNGILCFGVLSPRRLEYGTGDSMYWSSVTLTLTEVESRI
jgi:hypothetical protein